MFENATEFTIVARFWGEDRFEVVVPGRRKAVARMERVQYDRRGRKINTNLLRLSIGSGFRHTIGFVDPAGQAWDVAKQRIGRIYAERDENGDIAIGEFEQRRLGYLTRERLRPPVGGLKMYLERIPLLGPIIHDSRSDLVRYSSPDCAGFALAKSAGGSTRCRVTVQDDRIDRILVMACYLHEMRQGKLIEAGANVIAAAIYVFNDGR